MKNHRISYYLLSVLIILQIGCSKKGSSDSSPSSSKPNVIIAPPSTSAPPTATPPTPENPESTPTPVPNLTPTPEPAPTPTPTVETPTPEIIPQALTIGSPINNPLFSNSANLTLTGTCHTDALVQITGDLNATSVCTNNTYSVTLNPANDGSYNIILTQNYSGKNYDSLNYTWNRDTASPAPPNISNPVSNPFYSANKNLTLNGQCELGSQINLNGAQSQTTDCSDGTFSIVLSQNVYGNFSYQLTQTDWSGNTSLTQNFQWIISAAPSAPSITSPGKSPFYTKTNVQTITGTCANNAIVHLAGASSATTPCANGEFSFQLNNSEDGSYTYLITQIDLAGSVSLPVTLQWVIDTVAPAAVLITSPSTTQYASGDTSMTIIGNCESAQSTVSISGSNIANINCSAQNAFQINLNQKIDGIYDYKIVQTDAAGNISKATELQWIIDSTTPLSPKIISPAMAPYFSNTDTLKIAVTCDESLSPNPAIVSISGDIDDTELLEPLGSTTQDCISSPVYFTIKKSIAGLYQLTFNQSNPVSGNTSADTGFQWNYDPVPPPTPTLTLPTTNPFVSPGNLTIQGNCEAAATVNLSGDSIQNSICSNENKFSFTISKSIDADYNFTIHQIDVAGNSSNATYLTWTRNNNSLPVPTIVTPNIASIVNKDSSLIVSGICDIGYIVQLSGDVVANEVLPANSLNQECVSGSFSYTIGKISDGIYTFHIAQILNQVSSSTTSVIWNRDTLAPVINISSAPESINLSSSVGFNFTSNEAGSTFQCSLDGVNYSSCSAPITYTSLINGTHSWQVKAIDLANNTSSPITIKWTQASYNTLALYHFNSPGQLTDSSQYDSVGINYNLSPAGITPAIKNPSIFSTGVNLAGTIGYTAPNNEKLQIGSNKMTVEGFINLAALPTNRNYYTLISKSNGASPNYGWEIRLRRASRGSSMYLDFIGSASGASIGSTATSNSFSISLNTWNYFAVSWNAGVVSFYFSTKSRGNKTLSGVTALYPSNAPLRIGANTLTAASGSSLFFNGSIDELRISQVVRTLAAPASAYTAD